MTQPITRKGGSPEAMFDPASMDAARNKAGGGVRPCAWESSWIVPVRLRPWIPCVLACLIASAASEAAEYHVGPGQAHVRIGTVPWYALQAGDTVYIHHRTEAEGGAYHEKILISGRGTPTAWIRVLGVPGPNGERPVISGADATTSTNMHHRWQTPDLVQWEGVIQIAVRADDASGPPLPGYIEIAKLQVQDAYYTNRFTAENGTTLHYDGFAAAIYARSVKHLLIRDNVLANSGQGFYNWTGDGSNGGDTWWDGIQTDTVLRGNHFLNNGLVNSYTEHQAYTESDGVVYEFNHFGPQRAGALGSQLKDRSAGTVIRYNFIEQSPAGYDLDLVEPQESYAFVHAKPQYREAFVYGNVIVSGVLAQNIVHWNEDHYGNVGRAALPGGRLFFYHNTVMAMADATGWEPRHVLFNAQYGGYDCPPGALPGVIDFRNNLVAALPRTSGAAAPELRFAYCGKENFEIGSNWVTPGFVVHGAVVSGVTNLLAPADNQPGFVDPRAHELHLAPGSTALGRGGALAPEVTNNTLGWDLTPTQQYAYHCLAAVRRTSGAGSDLGALEFTATAAPLLSLTQAQPGRLSLSWEPPTPGFSLQSADRLPPTQWSPVAAGTSQPVTLWATQSAQFYRLSKP